MTEATENPVAAPTKKNGVCTKTIDGTTVKFDFTDGTVRERDITKYPEEVIFALACHGLSQKGGDSYAAAGGDVHFAVTQLDKVLTNLDAGILIGTRTSSGGAAKPESELVEAICELQSLDKTTVQNLLTAASDDEKKAIRANKHVKAKVLEIKARKAAAVAAQDTGSLSDLFKAA
jgi:hypothetical protein